MDSLSRLVLYYSFLCRRPGDLLTIGARKLGIKRRHAISEFCGGDKVRQIVNYEFFKTVKKETPAKHTEPKAVPDHYPLGMWHYSSVILIVIHFFLLSSRYTFFKVTWQDNSCWHPVMIMKGGVERVIFWLTLLFMSPLCCLMAADTYVLEIDSYLKHSFGEQWNGGQGW